VEEEEVDGVAVAVEAGEEAEADLVDSAAVVEVAAAQVEVGDLIC
jgi:hypothetical protein